MSTTSSKVALIFAAAIVISALVGGYAIMHRNDQQRIISVTGLGSQDFESDLIVWEGRFTRTEKDLATAFDKLKKDRVVIENYLKEKSVQDNQIVFSSVQNYKRTQPEYNSEGRYMGEKFIGYELSQTITIRSEQVAEIETLSRSITEVLDAGVQLYSNPPRYYYTGLSELKLDMIAKATRDARQRAEQIAQESGASLGKVVSAKMGIFQITGRLSNEDYSWSGAFNTRDKEKTASITMKLEYEVK